MSRLDGCTWSVGAGAGDGDGDPPVVGSGTMLATSLAGSASAGDRTAVAHRAGGKVVATKTSIKPKLFDVDAIAEVQRKFFGTLLNTYAFFALYANIDGFTHKEPDVAVSERPEIDRWILSELNSLIKLVDECFADYEPTKAARAIQDFVTEHLSNWYVRRNRRRFWKSEQGADKMAAYQTLYRC